jgi:hypothetical protein
MKFSIVVPVLDCESFLAEALDSLIAQSFENWECIVVDGGSTDRSLEIAQSYCKKDIRITMVQQDHSGIYDAIFQGFAIADGDILSWLNADDIYVPWALASAHLVLSRPKTDWIVGLSTVWDLNGAMRLVHSLSLKPRWMIRAGLFREDLFGCIQAESVFFTKTAVEQLTDTQITQIKKQKLAGDYFLWRALAETTKLHTIPVILGGFRIHGKNRSITQSDLYHLETVEAATSSVNARFSLILKFLFHLVSSPVNYWLTYQENRKLNLEIQSNMRKNRSRTQ